MKISENAGVTRKRLMHAAEVVPRHEEGDGRLQVSSFFENPFVRRVNRRRCIVA
jgi:hypothetical protein